MPYMTLDEHLMTGRPERLLPAPSRVRDGPAGALARDILQTGYLYRHQALALEQLDRTRNLIVSTGPRSGKTLVFQAQALDRLEREPHATVLAIYPLKALSRDQLARWRKAAAQAGLDPDIFRRIDGDTPLAGRTEELRRARLALMTPDVIQSWLMSYSDGNVRTRSPEVNQTKITCREFIRNLSLVIIDEAHVYQDVLGANFAFLVRRLRAKRQETGGPGKPPEPAVIAASAPLADPAGHMRTLTGLSFAQVTEEENGSPSAPLAVRHVLGKPSGEGSQEDIVRLAEEVLRESGPAPCMIFAGDRQRAERTAAGLRHLGVVHEDMLTGEAGRAGRRTGELAEEKTQAGEMRGTVCASTLESGIWMPEAETVISLGLANSAGEMRLRAGRTGGTKEGLFIIMAEQDAFRFDPGGLAGYWGRPPGPARVHAANRYIQEAQARCLLAEQDRKGHVPDADWPDGFGRTLEETGQDDSREPPQLHPHRHGMRDLPEETLAVRLKGASGSILEMPRTQAMRELYPGAAWRHRGQTYRVAGWHPDGTREVPGPHVVVEPAPQGRRTTPITRTGAIVRPEGAEVLTGPRGKAFRLDADRCLGIQEVVGYRAVRDRDGGKEQAERLYADRPGTPEIRRSVPTTATLLVIEEPWSGSPEVRERVTHALMEAMYQLDGVNPGDLAAAHRGITLTDENGETELENAAAVWDRAPGGMGLAWTLWENLGRYAARLLEIAQDPSGSTEPPLPLTEANFLDRWARSLEEQGEKAEEEFLPEILAPSAYNGTVFGSRLAASWAAWFDWRGVDWEYGPPPLAGWSPDFRIWLDGRVRYALVDQAEEFPERTARQIDASGWPGAAIILGASPGSVWTRERGRWSAASGRWSVASG